MTDDAMSEDEWGATPSAGAVVTFVIFMVRVAKLAAGGIFISNATRDFNATMAKRLDPLALAQVAERPELANHVDKVRGMFDSNQDEALQNGLILIAAVSAFEACFEDFCKGMLQTNPSVIEDKELPKPKYTMAQFLSASEEDKRDVVYQSIEASVGKSNGIGRCEGILKFFDLSEAVPQPIKDAFYSAQVIRHVWAHRTGIADKQFVRKAPHLGFKQDELVAVNLSDLSEYLMAILAYAMILINRHRALFGFDPYPLPMDSAPNSAVVNAFSTVYPRSPSNGLRQVRYDETPPTACRSRYMQPTGPPLAPLYVRAPRRGQGVCCCLDTNQTPNSPNGCIQENGFRVRRGDLTRLAHNRGRQTPIWTTPACTSTCAYQSWLQPSLR
jgi:hypothetical protein